MVEMSSESANGAAETPVTAEEILTVLKRRGLFDNIRKRLFTEFKESDAHSSLITAIQTQIESDTSIASLARRNRGKAAALLEGSVNRSVAFGGVNKYVERKVSTKNDELMSEIRQMIREVFQELQSQKNRENLSTPTETLANK
ncbi:complex proteins associated with Set1p component shg1-domain-containing protein [Lipomyces oligophaga]|uniref:complex proteins associated with Set1p component shg1-domain-containing protein n=1 Tax=Lipomyces oligophaga TaxID=45792 RepID=UPI0034CDE50E